MAAMSLLRRAAETLGIRRLLGRGSPSASPSPPPRNPAGSHSVPAHGGREKKVFYIRPTSYYDNRFLRLTRFYILLTGLPTALFITYINLFIGEAELAEIPEGYFPEPWEYFKHPITRWLARHIVTSPEKKYEKMMSVIETEYRKAELRLLELKARKIMKERGDGPWYHYPTREKNDIDDTHQNFPDY